MRLALSIACRNRTGSDEFRLMFVAASALTFLGGCTTPREIAVVESISEQCMLVQALKMARCGDDGQIRESDIEEFKRQARKVHANTIECCSITTDQILGQGRDPRDGSTCVEWHVRFATAYRCPAP